ncbi:MAG: glycosyltransferase [Bacteroidota bacterium]|nr:glycosyltransferase [Bacteroidota bacterium]
MLLGFGVDLVIHKTAEKLALKGFEVTVFCIRSDKTYSNKNYKVVNICCPITKNPLKNEINAINALKRLNHENIDLWIAETYPFFIASRVMKNPVIIVDHGVVSTEGFPFMKKLFFGYMKFTQNYLFFPKATRIISISNYIQSLTPSIIRKKQEIIYNGTDNYAQVNEEKIQEFKTKYGIKENDIVLLYVGRLNHRDQPYKGIKELTEIYKNLKKKYSHIKLIMAGFGNKKDKERLAKENIIPIVCAPVELMPILYQATDIYITASKWEGFNLPLIEAGSFGVPAVAYDVGPHKEVLQNNAGFLVKTSHEFQEKVGYLISHAKKRKEMSTAAIKNAERFTWEKASNKYFKIINKITSQSKLKRPPYNQGQVDVITLNYNGKKYLAKLFNSLANQTYQNIKVTMVDNGSSDKSVEYVRNSFPWVNLIVSKKNLFFSRGNNLAVSKTNGEYIFFINNDTVAKEDAIENMVKTIEKHGKYQVAGVSAKMLFYKDKKIIDSIGTVMISNGSPFNRGIGQIDIGQYDNEEEIFGACFGAAMVRRNVYEKTVGPLDNSYFGYFEDVDWCLRARNFGYKIYSSPKAIVYHDHSGSSKKNSYNWKYYLIQRNFIRTIIKNFELARAIKKTTWKIMVLIYHFFSTKEKGRKWIIVKIVGNTILFFPILLVKRSKIQSKKCKPDYEIIKFAKRELPVFDPVQYKPYYSLDNLYLMFSKLDETKKFKNPEVTRISSLSNYLNNTKGIMEKNMWEEKTNQLIDSTISYIGEEYANRFRKKIIQDRKQKQKPT